MEVTILNRQRGRCVDTRALSSFIARLTSRMPARAGDSLGVCLVSDRRMRRYNRDFRHVDRPTDVLAFPGGGPTADGEHHLGDIVISVQRAADQAGRAGHDLDREVRVLLIHGYLHLLGYDHETDDGSMVRAQRRLVRALLPREVTKER